MFECEVWTKWLIFTCFVCDFEVVLLVVVYCWRRVTYCLPAWAPYVWWESCRIFGRREWREKMRVNCLISVANGVEIVCSFRIGVWFCLIWLFCQVCSSKLFYLFILKILTYILVGKYYTKIILGNTKKPVKHQWNCFLLAKVYLISVFTFSDDLFLLLYTRVWFARPKKSYLIMMMSDYIVLELIINIAFQFWIEIVTFINTYNMLTIEL